MSFTGFCAQTTVKNSISLQQYIYYLYKIQIVEPVLKMLDACPLEQTQGSRSPESTSLSLVISTLYAQNIKITQLLKRNPGAQVKLWHSTNNLKSSRCFYLIFLYHSYSRHRNSGCWPAMLNQKINAFQKAAEMSLAYLLITDPACARQVSNCNVQSQIFTLILP